MIEIISNKVLVIGTFVNLWPSTMTVSNEMSLVKATEVLTENKVCRRFVKLRIAIIRQNKKILFSLT